MADHDVQANPQRLAVVSAIRETVREVRREAAPLGLLLLVGGAVLAAMQFAGRSLSPEAQAFAQVPVVTALYVLTLCILAVGAGRATPRLVRIYACAGLLAVQTLISVAGGVALMSQSPVDEKNALPLLGGALAVLALALVFLRLMLWPVGLLLGDPVDAGRSWRLMRGNMLRVIAGDFVIYAPFTSLALLAAPEPKALPTFAQSVLSGYASAGSEIMSAAFALVVYRALVRAKA